jgi:hypothetical protein
MFDITDSVAFYGKMIEDYDDLAADSDSARHAINCAISAYHLAEWIWGDWLQTDYDTWRKLKIRDRESFFQWVHEAQPWFTVVQDITNGSKHFATNLRLTKSSGVYVEDGYVDGYQQRVLEIEIELGAEKKWVEAVIVLEDVVMFWRDFFREHRPQAKLRRPAAGFTSMPD